MHWTDLGVSWNVLALFVIGVCCEALHALLCRSRTPSIDECSKRESALRLNSSATSREVEEKTQTVQGLSIHGDIIDRIVCLLLEGEGLVSLFLIAQVSKGWSRQYALCIEAAASRKLCLCSSEPLSSRMLQALLVHSLLPDSTSKQLECMSRLDEDWLEWAPEEWEDEAEAEVPQDSFIDGSNSGDAPVFTVVFVHLCLRRSSWPHTALGDCDGPESRRAGALVATHVSSYCSRCDTLHKQAAIRIKYDASGTTGLRIPLPSVQDHREERQQHSSEEGSHRDSVLQKYAIHGRYVLQAQLAVMREDGSIVQCLHQGLQQGMQQGLQHRAESLTSGPLATEQEVYHVLHPSCLPGSSPTTDRSEEYAEEEQEWGIGDPPVCHVAHTGALHGHELHLASTELSFVHAKDPDKTFTMYDLLGAVEMLQWYTVRSGLQRNEYEVYVRSLQVMS